MHQHYVFDLDGTLCDSLLDLHAASNQVRRHFGLSDLSPERVRSFIGQGIKRLLHRVLTDKLNGEAEALQHQQALVLFHDVYRKHLCVHTRLYPHVRETLAVLSASGVRMAVVTNKDEALARDLLQQLDIIHYFELVYGGDRFPQRKPHPEPLWAVQRYFGATSASMLMVGDSENDVLAAQAAGWRMVYCRYGFEALPYTHLDDYLDDFSQLLELKS